MSSSRRQYKASSKYNQRLSPVFFLAMHCLRYLVDRASRCEEPSSKANEDNSCFRVFPFPRLVPVPGALLVILEKKNVQHTRPLSLQVSDVLFVSNSCMREQLRDGSVARSRLVLWSVSTLTLIDKVKFTSCCKEPLSPLAKSLPPASGV